MIIYMFFKMKKQKFNIVKTKDNTKIIDYLFNNNCSVNQLINKLNKYIYKKCPYTIRGLKYHLKLYLQLQLNYN